jgi:hypothetical protein
MTNIVSVLISPSRVSAFTSGPIERKGRILLQVGTLPSGSLARSLRHQRRLVPKDESQIPSTEVSLADEKTEGFLTN